LSQIKKERFRTIIFIALNLNYRLFSRWWKYFP